MAFVVSTEESLLDRRVYINGHLHLHLKRWGYVAMYAFVDGHGPVDSKWVIEFYYRRGVLVRAEYNSLDKWLAVLDELKKII